MTQVRPQRILGTHIDKYGTAFHKISGRRPDRRHFVFGRTARYQTENEQKTRLDNGCKEPEHDFGEI